MPRHPLLSDAQRSAILNAHFHLDDRDIARYWTLSEKDLERINRRRRDWSRFGFAVQLCLLRFPGWPPKHQDRIPPPLLSYVGQQLEIPEEEIEDYFRRQPTRSEHLQELIDLYGFRFYTLEEGRELSHWLLTLARRWESPVRLVTALIEEMRRRQLVLPALSLIELIVGQVCRWAEEEAFSRLTETLSPLQRVELEDLLIPSVEVEERSLTWLRRAIGPPGTKGILDLIERLRLVGSFELNPTLAERVHPQRLRQLAARGARHTLQHLREYLRPKRHALLVAYLLFSGQQLRDELAAMYIRVVGRWFNKADKRHWQHFQSNGRAINRKLHDFRRLSRALLQARVQMQDLEGAVEAAIGWKRLAEGVEETEELAVPLDFSNLDQLRAQYGQVRQFSPQLLRTLEFRSIPRLKPLMKAVDVLRALNENEKSEVPVDAPRGFIRRAWRPYVLDGKKVDRAYYELCVLTELSLALRSGDVWVPGSRRFLPLEDYLLSQDTWKALSGTQPKCSEYVAARQGQLHEALVQVSEQAAAGQLPDVTLENGRLSVSPPTGEVPEDVESWSDRLYDLLPRIRLTDLLMEVDSWAQFSQWFTHLYSHERPADPMAVLTVILSDATNIGLTKMAEATPGYSYYRLSSTADWYVREENYAKALAEIVQKQHQVPLAAHWGPGTTSSSDGQAFPIPSRRPVLAHTNAKYGRDPVVMLYSHLSDRYAPFSARAISSTVRDATYVLDGLVDQGADLPIEEHYTDTAGFTDHIFALCYLLGFRFAPRIRDLPDKRLYTFNNPKQYGPLSGLVAGRVDAGLIQRNWDEMLRVAASIREGKVSASLLVSKLAAYPRQSELALALRELGRTERTLFTAEWWLQPELRRRVTIGLNKGELRNSLAKALRFYRRGAVADRSREEQQRKASGLNLAIAAIGLWNTLYLQKAIRALADSGNPVPDHVLSHLSPLGWEHITFTGLYYWRRHFRSDPEALRSLRPFKLPLARAKTA